MAETSWIDSNPQNFVPGDIICDAEDQSHLRIVVHVSSRIFQSFLSGRVSGLKFGRC